MKVKIEKIVYPGNGLVRTKNKTIIIEDNVVPGDIVEIFTKEEKNDFIKAGVKRFIKFSPYREKYICKYGGKCGGCPWMGIKYDDQLLLKREMLVDILKRNAKTEYENIEVIPSNPPYPYRQRIRVKIENGKIGFFKKNSHSLVEIKNCPIALPGVNRGITYLEKKIKQYKNAFPKKIEVEIRYSPSEDSILFKPSGKISKTLQNIFDNDINKGKNYQNFEIAGNNFHLSINTFIQVNPYQNKKVIEEIRQIIPEGSNIVELYGGFGNLTLPSIDKVQKLVIFEENKYAVEDGEYFAMVNGYQNKVTFINKKVEESLNEIPDADILILDPPRKGAKELFKNISNYSFKKIIYLSCNPSTLARDIKFAREMGFHLQPIKLFDFFPYTPEIESLALLEL